MIKIIIVDDLESKQLKIKAAILDNANIEEKNIRIVSSVKEAKKLVYTELFDLMILDLVLPIEDGTESSAKNSVKFLKDIEINPSIKPPIHIVGLSGYKEEVVLHSDDFSRKLWHLIHFDENSVVWEDQLKSIIFHLISTKKQFIGNSLNEQLELLFQFQEKNKQPKTFLGLKWVEICLSLSAIIEQSLNARHGFKNGKKAKNINVDTLVITSEYDFQNLINIVLKPWLPSLEAENISIIYDGNTKYADFSIKGNSIIVEVKYIDTTGKKSEVLKTLAGLTSFYSNNANVKSILFVILFEKGVKLDIAKIESDFSKIHDSTPTVVKVIENH
jgi:CheY-like chemotaxis protein